MLDYDEIRAEISKLENGDTTYSAVEKLALLYIVRDNEDKGQKMVGYSFSDAPQSDFLKAVAEAPLDRVLSVLDEHMEAVKILYPKEYEVVVNRIKQ